MVAPAVAPAVSPLGALGADERATVITALSTHLPPAEAVALLTALSGRPDEVAALPVEVRRRAQDVLLDAFPDGSNVVVLSSLGLAALEPAGAWVDALRERLERLGSMDEALATVRAWREDGVRRQRRRPEATN